MKPLPPALLTDLYQLTMMQVYRREGMSADASFEFFVRSLPEGWGFLLAAGLETVLEEVESLRFETEDLKWLRGTKRFHPDFIQYLETFRFHGEIAAMPEGTVFFPQEPILRVTASLPEAQLVETRIINLLQYQTLAATKAARMVLAAPGKSLVDFGLRRAHGAEAGIFAARSSFIAGFSGSSDVLAGRLFGIPLYGTMAHSFIQAHDDEAVAFERFARLHPGQVVLLIDTYDTEAAAKKVVALAPQLKKDGVSIDAVRLDSGDLAEHARRVRRILDDGGLKDVGIFASGGLNERKIEALAREAPIGGFGVGSALTTVEDAPNLDCAYKLVEYDGTPRWKTSEGKATHPYRKQVWREIANERLKGDTIARFEEAVEGSVPLLKIVMRGGRRVEGPDSLESIRLRAAASLKSLPEALKGLEARDAYSVRLTPGVSPSAGGAS